MRNAIFAKIKEEFDKFIGEMEEMKVDNPEYIDDDEKCELYFISEQAVFDCICLYSNVGHFFRSPGLPGDLQWFFAETQASLAKKLGSSFR